MKTQELIPSLFRTEYRKLTAVLCKHFGLEHIEIAEDLASDTFLLASETWTHKGLPENPTAWLYTVAKNKAKDYLKHHTLFETKIKEQLQVQNENTIPIDLDLSSENIVDSQLQMIFALCHPSIPTEAQIGLALRILCGFGIEEIANAFLSNKETIHKRLLRAREKLRTEKVKIEIPPATQLRHRLDTVLTTLYLLFNEGYYSASQDVALRKDLCLEAMRLTHLLSENSLTQQPPVYALLALMCFQASRFEARISENGATILYQEQDRSLWNTELITQGNTYLILASKGSHVSKYHLEAGIAYWHTQQEEVPSKWDHILHLYNQLLVLEYSPIAALNRTYALSKAHGIPEAIQEAEKLELFGHPLYHALLGELYLTVNPDQALVHLQKTLQLVKSKADKKLIAQKLKKLTEKQEKMKE